MDHPINIVVINNAVGVAQSSDGVMMLICKAVPISTTFAMDTAYLITQLTDLATLGITAALDVTNGTAIYQQISEFYQQAGDGAKLWVVGYAKASAFKDYVASATFKGIIRGTAVADNMNRVKMLGLCYDVPSASQTATDFPSDVADTITALQTVTTQLFNEGYQFSSIIDGYNMSTTVTPSTVGTMATKAAPSVSLCITGSKPNGVSSVGMALGRFARISIGHGFGAVADGPVVATTAFLTNGVSIAAAGTLTVGVTYIAFGGTVTYNGATYLAGQSFIAVTDHTTFTTADTGVVYSTNSSVVKLTPADVTSLGQKQFMFLRTWANHSGYFWNDGATCELSTKQLSTQEYNRVANSLSADALAFFIDEMGKNLPLDTKTGNVDAIYLNAKQKEFYDTYIAQLTIASGSGDLSDGSLVVSGVNFNATKTLNFLLNLVPTPILGKVNGTIQFSSTL
jgi:hypothetical protein